MSRQSSDDSDERDERDEREVPRERKSREDRFDRRRDASEADDPEWSDRRERSRHPPRYERGVVLFADRSGSIIRAGDESLEEDLPVLNAFRQFLEAERRRARRQLLTLLALFVCVVAGLAAGGFWYVRGHLDELAATVETEKGRTAADRLAVDSNVQAVARAAVTLTRDMQENRQESRRIRADIQAQVAELEGRLKDNLADVEIENSTLKREIRLLSEKSAEPPLIPETTPLPPPDAWRPPEPEPEPLPRPAPATPASAVAAPPPEPAAAVRPLDLIPPVEPADDREGVRADPTPFPDRLPGGMRFRLPLPR